MATSSEPHPQQSPRNLTLENTEPANLTSEIQNQQNKLTLENSQLSDLPKDQSKQEGEDNPEVVNKDNQDPDHQFGNPSRFPLTSPTPARRPIKRKGGLSWMKQKAAEKKVQTLLKTLNPIPFVPAKTLDFDSHEKLLKRLELWDFVHIEFDKAVRSDLLAQLIVNYEPKSRSSYVNGFRINVNRPSIGRALKLPVKREKGGGSGGQEAVVLDVEEYGEVTAFLEEFLSNWVLLHGKTWMMPGELMTWIAEIKNGQPEKVDWAGLFWFMVEKELSQGVKLEDCYYASHLQHMMKFQREEMFLFEDEIEVEVREEDNKAVEELNVGLTLSQENIEKKEAKDDDKSVVMEEEVNVELTLRQKNTEIEEAMDVEKSNEDECKGDVSQDHWILQHCNVKEDTTVIAGEESKLEEEGSEKTFLGDEGKETLIGAEEGEMKHWDVKENTAMTAGEEDDETKLQEEGEEEDGMKLEEEGEGTFVIEEEDGEMKLEEEVDREDEEVEIEEVDEEEEEDEDEFSLMPNQGLGSDGFEGNLQEIDMNNISYGVSGQFNDHTNMDIISPRVEPSFFGMKREISYDHNLSHNPLTQGNKRPRTDGSSSKSSESGLYIDQIQLWLDKTRVMLEGKEKEIEELSNNQQILINEVQQREHMFQHLQMTKYEELKKKDEEIYKLDRELFVMGNLINGYRDALKATRKDFSEYRERFHQREEPIYKDVGPGGLMLSVMEIERLRLKKEEEDRVQKLIVEQNVKQFEEKIVVEFEGHLNRVQMIDTKLMYLEKKVSQIKDIAMKGTVSQAMESTIEP